MANHLSAKKRIRQNKKRREHNRQRNSRIKTFIKRVEDALNDGKAKDAQDAFRSAMSEIHKGVTKGVVTSNAADRKISRLNKRVKQLALAQ
jgi:small subunit ribosomal protein S20